MNKFVLSLLIAVFVTYIFTTTLAAAEYASIRLYFNIPRTTTFTLQRPNSYITNADMFNISGTTTSGATDAQWITFNFTTPLPQNMVEPYYLGNSSQNQITGGKPILRIDPTGNTNLTLTIWLNETLPANGGTVVIKVMWNGTCTTPAGAASTGGYCGNATPLAGGPTNLTNDPERLVVNLSETAYYNLTLWANATATAPFGQTTANMIINSTFSGSCC